MGASRKGKLSRARGASGNRIGDESQDRYPVEVIRTAIDKLVQAGVDTEKLVQWLQAAIPNHSILAKERRRLLRSARAAATMADSSQTLGSLWNENGMPLDDELNIVRRAADRKSAILRAQSRPKLKASLTMIQIMSIAAVRRATGGMPRLPHLATILDVTFAKCGWPTVRVNERQLEKLWVRAQNSKRLSRFVLNHLPDLRIELPPKPDILKRK